MSLRIRLTWFYTGLLSFVILVLIAAIYFAYSLVMIRDVDSHLQRVSDKIIDAMVVDDTSHQVSVSDSLVLQCYVRYQVWSKDGQLFAYSENTRGTKEPLAPSTFDHTQKVRHKVEIDQQLFRVLSSPIRLDEQIDVFLQVGEDITTLRDTQQLLLIILVVSAIFLILIAWYISWIRVEKFLEPLNMMSEIADNITNTNDLSKRIPLNSKRNDEANHLVLIFNNTLARLERLLNSQRRFLADVTHELRTPLTVIKGNVGLMRMMKKYDAESLTSIETEVDRLTRLVGDLLLMTQAETGKLPLFFEIVEVDTLIFDVFNQMKVLSNGKHDIRVGNIEPATVTGDRDRLKQVLLNLGSNAIKYAPPGSKINLSLSLKEKWIQINVSDEGPGIPKEQIKFIFERFYRGDKARSRSKETGGYGLGLPIAYWIVHNHGGRIEVESEMGKGTTFSVWLPISQMDVPTQPLRPKSKSQRNIDQSI